MIKLYDHQKKAIDKLSPGSILCGGVGTGKSRVSIAYYIKYCSGVLSDNGNYVKLKNPLDLYIITTAKKRDCLDWEKECAPFCISKDRNSSISNVKVTIDSWNNISKYKDVKNAFFILDEQRLVGSGKWVKSFWKIAKSNAWILLSATPGDTWEDYIPVFVANKFYKNKTEFLREHAVFNRFTKYPKIDRFIGTTKLSNFKSKILVIMNYKRNTISNHKTIKVDYNKKEFEMVVKKRWDPYTNKPVKNISELCYLMRKVVNTDFSRMKAVTEIINKHDKVIIFYNFNYELEMLLSLGKLLNVKTNQWNGHKHEEVPKTKKWIYLVQYTAGAEGWNCVDTDTILFYSQNYSYKIMTQAAGRIDRLNTKFINLYYYHLRSSSLIDIAILSSIKKKKIFNATNFIKKI